VPLWGELFLLLSSSGFITLVDESGESRYVVVRLLLASVDCHAHSLGLFFGGDSDGLRQKRGVTEDDWPLRTEICSARREMDVFVGTEDERRLGIEMGFCLL
jgi:hypothetical protein